MSLAISRERAQIRERGQSLSFGGRGASRVSISSHNSYVDIRNIVPLPDGKTGQSV